MYTLNKKQQIDLMAEYRLSLENGEQIKKRRDKIKNKKLKKLIEAKKGS
jgi:hypothetical protein